MYLLISKMFEDENVDIDTMEIEHSYCPGKFDLSIDGKKFAGISQRKLEAVLLYKFIFVLKGSGSERALTMQTFYEHALKR